MIPQGGSLNEIVARSSQPSATWRLNLERGRIAGRTDGLDAVRQAVFKILQTERFRHDVYSGDYGNELTLLIGRQASFVPLEAKRLLEEALTQDDRITGVDNVAVTREGDGVSITFTVVTNYGSFEEEVSGFV